MAHVAALNLAQNPIHLWPAWLLFFCEVTLLCRGQYSVYHTVTILTSSDIVTVLILSDILADLILSDAVTVLILILSDTVTVLILILSSAGRRGQILRLAHCSCSLDS